MSLKALEDEARKIVRDAELKAEEIIAKARKEAEEILKKDVAVELPKEVISNLESEYVARLSEARKNYEARIKIMKERYIKIRDELVKEYVKLVLGL